MPRFNDAGAVTPQLGFYWYDQAQFVSQDCDRPCPGMLAPPSGGPPPPCPSSNGCHVRLTDGTVLAHHPTHTLDANGHRVWAYVEHVEGVDPTQVPYHDSFGRARVNSFPRAIGPDGNICIKPHSNLGATVLEPDGTEWQLSTADAWAIQLLRGQRAFWMEGAICCADFPLIGAPTNAPWSPRVADDGTVLYQHQPEGALVLGGKVIGEPSAHYHYLDVLLLDGIYYVAWSPNQADTDAQVREFTAAQLAALPRVEDVYPNEPIPIPPEPPDPGPEPPEPEPGPKPPEPKPPEPPQPEPPKGPRMIAYGLPLKDFAPGEEHDNGNGTVSIKKPNGQWLCVTPDMKVEERPSPGGVWESFIRGDTGYIAQREGPNGDPLVYVLPYVVES